MTRRTLAWVVGIAVAVVLAVILSVNGIRSAQLSQKLRECELRSPVGTAQYDACAAAARR